MTKIQEIFNEMYQAGFDADSFFSQLHSGTTRYKLAIEGASIKLDTIDESVFTNLNKKIKLLVIGSTKCGDTITAIPGIHALVEKIPEWSYSIVNKPDYLEYFKEYFMVGSKGTVPQVIFANEDGSIISKWIEKSINAKQLIKKMKESDLSDEEMEQLNSKIEVGNVIEELISMGKKAVFYI